MQLKIEVTSEAETVRGEYDGRQYSFMKQTAYAHLPTEKYPVRVDLRVPKDMPHGYATGEYVLLPESIYVDKRGKLAINPKLQRVGETKTGPVRAAGQQ